MSTEIVIKRILVESGLTQEKFTDLLNEGLVNSEQISRPTINSWLLGKWKPKLETLFTIFSAYRINSADWRFKLSVDLLCAKLPEIFTKNDAGELVILGDNAQSMREKQ